MKRCKLIHIVMFVAFAITSSGCQSVAFPPVDPYPTQSTTTMSPIPAPTSVPATNLDQPDFSPDGAKYFDLVQQTLALTPEEQELLTQNGFVLSERLAFEDFTMAYGYIYWKDMPVIVTTDSILHTIHQNYDDILIFLEKNVFYPQLIEMLSAVRTQLKSESPPRALRSLYRDLEIYLTVPLILLTHNTYDGNLRVNQYPHNIAYNTPGTHQYAALAGKAEEVGVVKLFSDKPYKVDFTLFKPRGHYTDDGYQARYFRAMLWLAQCDFRFVTYDPLTSEPEIHPDAIAAATILRDTLDKAGMRETWEQFDALLAAFVGRSDNMRLGNPKKIIIQKMKPNAGSTCGKVVCTREFLQLFPRTGLVCTVLCCDDPKFRIIIFLEKPYRI